MNKFIVSLLLITTSLSSIAQTQMQTPYPKTITVTGSAELEIVPDEIYVQVDLKEYEKKGQGKISIEKIRQDFLTAVRSLAIADSNISIAGYGGTNGDIWWRKKKKLKDELYASITYSVKLKSSTQVDQLVDKLDDEATQNFFIQRTSHSKLTELRKQLKIAAVKAAKEKAKYFAEAIDEKIGVAVTINEPNEFYQPYYRTSNTIVTTQGRAMGESEEPQADFKKIKLKYEVIVIFELK